jgi:hypothetical protein
MDRGRLAGVVAAVVVVAEVVVEVVADVDDGDGAAVRSLRWVM